MQWTIRIQLTSSNPMEWCLAIITYQGACLEAGPTDSSAQGHTPSSSSLSISARYGGTWIGNLRSPNSQRFRIKFDHVFVTVSNGVLEGFMQWRYIILQLKWIYENGKILSCQASVEQQFKISSSTFFLQAQQHMVAERNGGHRRQQAYITPTIATQAPYSFHHNSPSHTGNVHPHLAATHLPSQPHLYTYTAPAALGSTGTVAHLVASQGSARHAVQHGSYPPSIVHQVPVSMGHRVLPSPTLHHSQYQAQFAHQAYISASPASTVYTGYPLSPTKVNQYPYL